MTGGSVWGRPPSEPRPGCDPNQGYETEKERHHPIEPLFRRALELRARALGPEHPDTLATRKALENLQHRSAD